MYHGKSGCLLLSLVAGSTLLAADSAEAPTTSFKAKACSPLHLKANTGSPLQPLKGKNISRPKFIGKASSQPSHLLELHLSLAEMQARQF